MMDQTHIGYTYWQEPPRNTMPRVDVIQLPRAADMGVAVVEAESRAARPDAAVRPGVGPPSADARGRAAGVRPVLATDVSHRRLQSRPDAVRVSRRRRRSRGCRVAGAAARSTKEQRVAVSVDWTRAPVGRASRADHVHRTERASTVVVQASSTIRVTRRAIGRRVRRRQRLRLDGSRALLARRERRHDSTGSASRTSAGRCRAMTTTPVTSPSQTPGGNAPRLEYRVFLFDSGAVKVHAYLSPTLNFCGSNDGLRYAISFDDQPPQIVERAGGHVDARRGRRPSPTTSSCRRRRTRSRGRGARA